MQAMLMRRAGAEEANGHTTRIKVYEVSVFGF